MDDIDVVTATFEQQRTRLKVVAYRVLGSASEAEDAVQEAWIRLNRSDTDTVNNLRGWLTTVVARVALDMLRSRQSRPEEPIEHPVPEKFCVDSSVRDPEQETILTDSVGLALLVVLDTLNPAERVAFVLHDLFAVPFEDIATVLDRSPNAAKQLASRARRRVHNGTVTTRGDDNRKRAVVKAFLAASRGGDLSALVAVLHPDVTLRADEVTVTAGAPAEVLGAEAVAGTFAGRARAARLALIDGRPGAVWSVGGQPRVVFRFTVVDDLITAIEMISEPDRLADIGIITRM